MQTAVLWMYARRRDHFSLIKSTGFYLNTDCKKAQICIPSVSSLNSPLNWSEYNFIACDCKGDFVCPMEMLYHFDGGKNMISKKHKCIFPADSRCSDDSAWELSISPWVIVTEVNHISCKYWPEYHEQSVIMSQMYQATTSLLITVALCPDSKWNLYRKQVFFFKSCLLYADLSFYIL